MPRASTVLYVIIDRPEDQGAHDLNIQGLTDAAAAFDDRLRIVPVTIYELQQRPIQSHRPYAVFSAGSYSEWFQYGLDASWRAALDDYMNSLRTIRIPTLAVCGSHQLLAAAMNGWSAVAHMTDTGEPILVSHELELSQSLIPDPRVGEEGTYPLAVTRRGARDRVVAPAIRGSVVASLHHKDMVVDTRGATVLLTSDLSREPATTAGDPSHRRCFVQGLRWHDRPLWSVQFHPEVSRFAEATEDDRGFGRRLLRAWLAAARRR
jgi:GMP synthase-like glutamine amidotransferase